MKKITGNLLLAIALIAGYAGNALAQTPGDVEAIKKLCGCFSVTFNYAETFTNDTLRKHVAGPMDLRGVVEYAYPIEETPGKIVIQHLLVIPDGKGTVIKHWREDWVYEQTERWEFEGNRQWKKVKVPLPEVKGQWTQSVWEVTDEPRYMGSSAWLRRKDITRMSGCPKQLLPVPGNSGRPARLLSGPMYGRSGQKKWIRQIKSPLH